MIKSPLRYPGGKSRAVETISKLIPDFDEFVFGWGIGIFVKQHFPNKSFGKRFVFELYTLGNVTKEVMFNSPNLRVAKPIPYWQRLNFLNETANF